jgi:hypothetical protein
MFVVLSSAVLAVFLALTIVLPFRFGRRAAALVERAQDIVVQRARSASFDDDGSLLRLVRRSRYLGTLAALLFIVLCVKDGALVRNEAGAFVAVLCRAAVSLGAGGILVATVIGLVSFVPKAQGYALLARHGFRGLWTVELKEPAPEVRECLARRIQASTRVGIVDITGFELLGKGPGPSGGLLHDVLDSFPNIPVELLLLKPDARVLDPEEIMATVFQSLLAEMDISSNTYMKRVQATLHAAETLNENRPPEARIEVRFFSEKPMVRAIILDDVALVSPWHPRENQVPVPVLEILRGTKDYTFHEAFRRHFARLWGTGMAASSQKEKRRAPQLQLAAVSP